MGFLNYRLCLISIYILLLLNYRISGKIRLIKNCSIFIDDFAIRASTTLLQTILLDMGLKWTSLFKINLQYVVALRALLNANRTSNVVFTTLTSGCISFEANTLTWSMVSRRSPQFFFDTVFLIAAPTN